MQRKCEIAQKRGRFCSLFFIVLSQAMVEAKVEGYIKEKFEEPGFEDYYIVEIKFNPANKKLEVFIDSDSGLSLGNTSKLNRYLQGLIDDDGMLGEKYILDVSSPGIGRPLTLLRQYKKNIGRTLEILHNEEGEEKKNKGLLTEVDEEKGAVTIRYEIKEKIGKKNVKSMVDKTILLSDIAKAKVKVTF